MTRRRDPLERVSPEVRARMAALMPWQFHGFGEHGLSYHACRFCRQGVSEVEGLWKYGVRHYVCDACRNAITSGGAK